MASAEGGRGVASAPQVQEQRGGPARGAEESRPWDVDWGAVPDPLGGETLPLVGEVYGWLCWANQGTSRRSAEPAPSMPCSSGGTEETERHPRGGGRPQRTTRGSSGQ